MLNDMKTIKILFITQWTEMYGANRSMIFLILDLKKRYGVEPFVIIPPLNNEAGVATIDEVLEEQGIKYCFLNMEAWRTNFEGQDQLHIFYYKFRKFFRNKKLVRKFGNTISWKPDIIYSNSSVIDLGILLSIKLKIPHIWHIRESKESHNLQYIYPMSIVRRIYAKSNVVIAISRYIQNECEKNGINSCLIYNGIDICPAYTKEYYSNHKVNFAVVGVLNAPKRQMDVVEASHILKEKGYYDFKIYLIGEGEEKEKIIEQVEKWELGDQIEVCGFLKNPQSILKEIDVGIMPSSFEPFGRATIEYMMNYMPVIGNDTGATPELIKGKGFGEIYHFGDSVGLAGCMEKFLKMDNSIKDLGDLARKEAEKYSLSKNTDKVYEQIVRVIK